MVAVCRVDDSAPRGKGTETLKQLCLGRRVQVRRWLVEQEDHIPRSTPPETSVVGQKQIGEEPPKTKRSLTDFIILSVILQPKLEVKPILFVPPNSDDNFLVSGRAVEDAIPVREDRPGNVGSHLQ